MLLEFDNGLSLSVLDINTEKTKVLKPGVSRDNSITWQIKCGLNWSDTFEILGIH